MTKISFRRYHTLVLNAQDLSRPRTEIDVTEVDVTKILPHQPPMLMVREVVEVRDDGACCAGWIDDASPFACDGWVTVQLALELAAQSAAVCAACHEAREGTSPRSRSGYLATLRDVRFQTPTVPTGARLLADVQPMRNLGGLALYATEVRFADGRLVLQGAFSVSTAAREP